MKLTAVKIKNSLVKDKDYKLADGNGLYLLVSKSGGKYWRYNYRFHGKQKTYSLGVYPDMSLKDARDKLHQIKSMVSAGVDPSYDKKVKKMLSGVSQSNSFDFVAHEFIESRAKVLSHGKPKWDIKSVNKAKGRLKNYVYPYIGKSPIELINATELLVVLRKIETKGFYETAHRVRSLCSQIFKYGIATQRCTHDPASDLVGALVPMKSTGYAAITEPAEIGRLLNSIDVYHGSAVTCHALKLAPLTLVRPTELRHAEIAEFDLNEGLWTISAEKMKMDREHIIPLSRQAVEIVKSALNWSGKSVYLFPAMTTNKRPMSENTVLQALRGMGYSKQEMTGHGFRTMGSTLLNEMGYDPDWVEMQLSHEDSNRVRSAYNRAKYLPQRRVMLQEWADYLDKLRAGVL